MATRKEPNVYIMVIYHGDRTVIREFYNFNVAVREYRKQKHDFEFPVRLTKVVADFGEEI